jgi:transposase
VSADTLHFPTAPSGLTVADVARRYRVSPDKVRQWIKRGELSAINAATALCGKPRWVVPPESLVQFERRRRSEQPAPHTRRRRKRTGEVDYYPDL